MGHNLFSDTPASGARPHRPRPTPTRCSGPLANYGGPTATMALLPGSPAIDAGISVAGVTTDQRGIARPQGSAPDIGAFESRGFTLAIVTGGNQSTPVRLALPDALRIQRRQPLRRAGRGRR